MNYSVSINPSSINFRPESILEEIFQNINTIVSTNIYSVPLFREFGVDGDFVDDPTPIARVRFSSEIIEKVEQFEPRVIVREVKYEEDGIDGRLIPILNIEIREEVVL